MDLLGKITPIKPGKKKIRIRLFIHYRMDKLKINCTRLLRLVRLTVISGKNRNPIRRHGTYPELVTNLDSPSSATHHAVNPATDQFGELQRLRIHSQDLERHVHVATHVGLCITGPNAREKFLGGDIMTTHQEGLARRRPAHVIRQDTGRGEIYLRRV